MILTDNETKVDLLNNEAIAASIIGLLRAKPDHPMTIGVHGDWGAGKSSVLEMIEAGFAEGGEFEGHSGDVFPGLADHGRFRKLYFMMHHKARTPSRQPIFLPSA